MIIRPSAAIRQNYNEIAELCRKTEEPVFLTKNGEGDLVVMDIETYNRREDAETPGGTAGGGGGKNPWKPRLLCRGSRGDDAQRDPGGVKSWKRRVITV